VNEKKQVHGKHERGAIGLAFQEAFGANGGQRGGSRGEPNLLEGLRRFIDGRSIEAALPQEFKRRGFVLDNYERLGGITNRGGPIGLHSSIGLLQRAHWREDHQVSRGCESSRSFDRAAKRNVS
jgi:hypothetical protein